MLTSNVITFVSIEFITQKNPHIGPKVVLYDIVTYRAVFDVYVTFITRY